MVKRVCTTCLEAKPATARFFYRIGQRLHRQCKTCIDAKNAASHLTQQWCANCGEGGHSSRDCTSRATLPLAVDLADKPRKPARGYWVACYPSFPADHPARTVPLAPDGSTRRAE